MTPGRSPRVARDRLIRRATAIASLFGVALWLGGLLALGAIAAPVVFSTVAMPASADAMTVVFRRFDSVAMACAAVVLASEAARVLARIPFGPADHVRAGAGVLAGVLAVFEGESVSPRIAALHAAGVVRGLGDAGAQLARLHDIAELCGTIEVALLAAVVVAQVIALSRGPASGAP
jgi:putative copper export protein